MLYRITINKTKNNSFPPQSRCFLFASEFKSMENRRRSCGWVTYSAFFSLNLVYFFFGYLKFFFSNITTRRMNDTSHSSRSRVNFFLQIKCFYYSFENVVFFLRSPPPHELRQSEIWMLPRASRSCISP